MIEFKKGNLFNDFNKVEAIINTVNCVGVMGKGIAKEFSRRFPELLKEYKFKCSTKELTIGRNHIYVIPNHGITKYIVNFPTKNHWRNDSKLEYIDEGLNDLVKVLKDLNINSIALPALGCGNGNLKWDSVKPLIEKKLGRINDVKVVVYEPTIQEKTTKHKITKPKLTKDRKKLLLLMNDYNNILNNPKITYKEINALSYLLQYNNPKVKFELREFGPYSQSINPIITSLAKYYIKPLQKLDSEGATPIDIVSIDFPQKKLILNDQDFKNVKNLIYGFEEKNKLFILVMALWMFNTYKVVGEELTCKLLSWMEESSYDVDRDNVDKAIRRIENNFYENENLFLDLK